MECHAEGAKLSDSVELSASVAALRKVPGGEQVGFGGSWGLVGFGWVWWSILHKIDEVSQFSQFHRIQ